MILCADRQQHFTEKRLRTIGQNLPAVRSAASISHIFHIAQQVERGSAGKHARTRKVGHRVYLSAAPYVSAIYASGEIL